MLQRHTPVMACGLIALLAAGAGGYTGSASPISWSSRTEQELLGSLPIFAGDACSYDGNLDMEKGKCVDKKQGGETKELPIDCCSGLLSRLNPCGKTPKIQTDNSCLDVDWVKNVDKTCCQGFDISIRLEVMGQLGGSEAKAYSAEEKTERLNKAMSWIFQSILRALFDDDYYKDFGSSSQVAPTNVGGLVREIPAWQLDPKWTDKTTTDRRSNFLRTVFEYKLEHITGGWGTILAGRMCKAYANGGKELAMAFVRSLELSGLYPFEAMSGILNGGNPLVDVRSAAVLTTKVSQTAEDGRVVEQGVSECKSEQPKKEDAGGFFFSPECPDLTAFCDAGEKEGSLKCSTEEKAKQWLCKCKYGYTGSILLDPATGKTEGKCEPAEAFCKVLPNTQLVGGNVSVGRLGELIEGKCIAGFKKENGPAECKLDPTDKTKGYYTSTPTCVFLVPNSPPAPRCTTPTSSDLTVLEGSLCNCAPPYLTKTTGDCDCKVQCSDSYVRKDNQPNAPTQAPCEIQNFSTCGETKWNAMTQECTRSDTNEITLKFCCADAWKPVSAPDTAMPELTLSADQVCRDITDIAKCYRSQDRDNKKSCCWQEKGWGAEKIHKCLPMLEPGLTDSKDIESQCAVRRWVPVGKYDTQACARTCPKPVAANMDIEEGCDKCYDGQGAACVCKVKCSAGYEHLGGAPVGSINCDGGKFALPICRMNRAADIAKCPPLTLATGSVSQGLDLASLQSCTNKLAKPETCEIKCKEGMNTKRKAAAKQGTRTCTSKDEPLLVADSCQAITNMDDCLKKAEVNKPCCWREEEGGFKIDSAGQRAKCVQMGSAFIGTGGWPIGFDSKDANAIIMGCAETQRGVWDVPQAPECFDVCPIAPLIKTGVTFSEGCEPCVLDDDDCGCEAKCDAKSKYKWYGGNEEGEYSCTLTDPKSGIASFDPAPLCKIPDGGERVESGSGDDTNAVAPTCTVPDFTSLNAKFSADCSNCLAQKQDDVNACKCKVACGAGYLNRNTVNDQTEKRCLLKSTGFPSATCKAKTDRGGCLGAMEGGKPCCWNSNGLTEEGAKCEARGSKKMTAVPEICAAEFKGEWDPMPTCKQKCDMSSLNIGTNVEKVGCAEGCVVGEDCACELTCATGYEKVGGGSVLLTSRRCDADGNLFKGDHESPICWPTKVFDCDTNEPLKDSLSLTKRGSTWPCVINAGEACYYDAQCAAGYARTDAPTGAAEAATRVNCIPKELTTPGTCDAAGDASTCFLRHEMDGATKVPCCWRSGGFEGGKKCAKMGAVSISTKTPPDQCATILDGQWEAKFPPCKKKCVNDLATRAGTNWVINPACDACFIDDVDVPADKKCKCSVSCKEGFWSPGATFPPILTCDAGLAKFPSQPVCVSKDTKDLKKFCASPSGAGIVVKTGTDCVTCDNNGGACTCEIGCSDTFKMTGGTAIQKCIQGAWECPGPQGKPDLNQVKIEGASCKKSDGTQLVMACCLADTAADWNTVKATGYAAVWQAPVVCEAKCPNVFKGDASVVVTGDCDSCIASAPGACTCQVGCDPTKVYYGGGPNGDKRVCKNSPPVFDPAAKPVCGAGDGATKILETATCSSTPLTQKVGLGLEGCTGCTINDQGAVQGTCTCKTSCKSDYLADKTARATLPKTINCVRSASTRATVPACSAITSTATCLGSEEGVTKPCCLTKAGKCLVQGSPEHKEAPAKCALNWLAVFESPPACYRKCDPSLLKLPSVTVSDGCNDCYLSQTDCSCSATCSGEGIEYKGGGANGARTCLNSNGGTDQNLPSIFGKAPICAKKETLATCKRSSINLVAQKLSVPSDCVECSATGTGCDKCLFTCAAGFAHNRVGTEPGLKKCQAPAALRESTTCNSRTTQVVCTGALDTSATRCCWQPGRTVTDQGTCRSIGSADFDPELQLPVCGLETRPVWDVMPVCVPAAVIDNTGGGGGGSGDTVVITGDCTKCAAGKPCPECKIKCKPGLEYYGGVPESDTNGYVVTPTADGKIILPLCAALEPAPKCKMPQTAADQDLITKGTPGLAAWASVKLVTPDRCGSCAAGSSNCCLANCQSGYTNTGASLADKYLECKEDTAARVLKSTAECKSYVKIDDCLGAKDSSANNPLCCWSDNKCIAKGSTSMTKLPAIDATTGGPQCAMTKTASFAKDSFPQCIAKCPTLTADEGVALLTCSSCNAEEWTVKGDVTLQLFATKNGAAGAPPVPANTKFLLGVIDQGWHFVRPTITGDAPTFSGWAKAADVSSSAARSSGCDCQATCAAGTEPIPGDTTKPGPRSCRLDIAKNRPAFDEAQPKCSTKCVVPDDQLGTLKIFGCDQCYGGAKDCSCEVRCHTGNRKVGGGEEGNFRCGFSGWEGSFPTCQPFCPVPGTQGGTLDTSACRSECAANDKNCACQLTCNYLYRRTGGGAEGPYACTFSRGKVGTPAKSTWVSSSAGCIWTDSVASGMSTGSSCPIAKFTLPPCNSDVQNSFYYTNSADAFDGPVVGSSGGSFTDGICPGGVSTKEPQSVTTKKTCTCAGTVLPGLLVCMPVFALQVASAKDNSAISGAQVQIYRDAYWKDVAVTKTTDSTGVTRFTEDVMVLRIKVMHPMYSDAVRIASRDLICGGGQAECTYKISMLLKPPNGIDLGVTDEYGCHMVSDYSGVIAMTAVLEWNDKIMDLDIWTRAFDCGIDAEIRYNCGIGTSIESSTTAPNCNRADFYDEKDFPVEKSGTTIVERLQCPVQGFFKDDQGGHAKDLSAWASRRRPAYYWLNDFHKWVSTWNKKMTGLEKRVIHRAAYKGDNDYTATRYIYDTRPQPAVISTSTLAKLDNSFVVLDVDAMQGFGPETMSFNNVPPGRFQIVVNQWSVAGGALFIQDAVPRVTIQMGNVQFECRIQEACAAVISARLWYVADLFIGEQQGPDNGKYIHKIKILDQRRSMERLTRQTLPADPLTKVEKQWRAQPGTGQQYWVWRYSAKPALGESTSGEWPLDQTLNTICYGMCEHVDVTGTSPTNFRRCLDRDFWDMDHTINGKKVAYETDDERTYLVKYYNGDFLRYGDQARILAAAWRGEEFRIKLFRKEDGTTPEVVAVIRPNTRQWSYVFNGQEDSPVVRRFPWDVPPAPIKIRFAVVQDSNFDTLQVYINGELKDFLAVSLRTQGIGFNTFTFEKIVVQSLTNVEFEYERRQIVQTGEEHVKNCNTPCSDSECRGQNGAVTCWAGEVTPRTSANACFAKYTQPESGRTLCWSQRKVGQALDCCTGR